MVSITLSEKDYQAFEQAEKSLVSLQHKVEKLIEQKNESRKREASLAVMLGKACDEMEGIFSTTGQLASPEIATDYTVWARYLEINYGRTNHLAYEVQEWIEKQ